MAPEKIEQMLRDKLMGRAKGGPMEAGRALNPKS
jgi:hypothetical protein